ncbi:pilus assembly PilX family protein [Desulfobulbus alkaliphilus]|uniref:pilus assembly PilX family protein n=1 Tax=Desulfobulbus alkaliphilus TaxID=869814 RepID=UPI001965F272|nr:pilus assembly PilX N-terminal domain-containing protein [Desulfobulbus alkaliphilus]MBM9535542.1 pilus assembly PilX N-terminal domain-containing protein [Desulfobulbus alkaliphilus]
MKKILNNEQGFVLVTALMILVMVTIIGIAATNTTIFELQISGNETATQMAFYGADAGNEVAKELIEQAIEARGLPDDVGIISISNNDFWLNDVLDPDPEIDSPTLANQDAELPFNNGTTRLRIGGQPELAYGGAIQMAAGYEGVGKGAAGGGSLINYTIRSHHEGVKNSEQQIRGQWRHVN